MNQFLQDTQFLIKELQKVESSLDIGKTKAALDKLELHRETIDYILCRAGRPQNEW